MRAANVVRSYIQQDYCHKQASRNGLFYMFNNASSQKEKLFHHRVFSFPLVTKTRGTFHR